MALNSLIEEFYDQSTPLWLKMWGEHMHHGHYGQDGSLKKDKHQAQIDMIEALLKWSGTPKAKRVLDAGCGVGGSARYLAKKFDATVVGYTLSPVQVGRGQAYSIEAGLEDQVALVQKDMMTLNAEDGQFDLIWSMESAEHIKSKQQLFDIFYDRLAPGGSLIMATWCHRDEPPNLIEKELTLLDKVYRLYHLPSMVSIPELQEMATISGFIEIETDDWSKAIAPFWQTVIRTALTPRGIAGLLASGTQTIKGAWAMRYMKQGYKMGLIQFGVLHARKPK